MGKYILRRILIFIPTLIVITLLAFIISISAPGDPVEQLLNVAEQQGMSGSVEVTKKLKEEKRKELGLDLPVFYFSLGTAADIDTIYKIGDAREEAMLKRLCRETGNPEKSLAYYKELKSLQEAQENITLDSSLLEGKPEDEVNNAISRSSYITTNLLGAVSKEYTLNSFDTLRTLYTDYLALMPLQERQQRAEFTFNDLLAHQQPWRIYIPSLQIHGLSNQYHLWISKVIKGDFGLSYRDQQPVLGRIAEKFTWSFVLTFISVLLAYLISIPLGVNAAYKRDSVFDRLSAVILFILYSLPSFFVGTLLLVLFANPDFLNWFPESGVQDPASFDPEWPFGKKLIHWLPYLILPVITYTYSSFAFLSRQMRTGMLEVIKQDFIRTARAKGLSESKVIWKHAFRNALLPIITVFASVFPMAVGGAVIIETIFAIPGMGREIYDSIITYDYPMIVAIFFIFGIMTLIGYLVADILYALADPRISFNRSDK